MQGVIFKLDFMSFGKIKTKNTKKNEDEHAYTWHPLKSLEKQKENKKKTPK